ncbi:hypothetical protein [Actinokineospora sp.]|uniref:hypothetical protein n=1 Tax=Actinokineospora sp. TaxID=1872133 RepID=UPI00403761C8
MDDGGFQPSTTQREWLDSLDSEEQRAAALARMTTLWSMCEQIARSTDAVADRMLPHARGKGAVDWVMAWALRAEALRALGRGEGALADEHFAAAARYQPAVLPEIVIEPDGTRDGGPSS